MLIVRSRVSLAAARWQAEGRRAGLLLSEGKPLDEAEGLLSGWEDELSRGERELIVASREGKRRRVRLKATGGQSFTERMKKKSFRK